MLGSATLLLASRNRSLLRSPFSAVAFSWRLLAGCVSSGGYGIRCHRTKDRSDQWQIGVCNRPPTVVLLGGNATIQNSIIDFTIGRYPIHGRFRSRSSRPAGATGFGRLAF